MNQELKALLDLAFDALQLGEDAVGKSYFNLIGDMVKVLGDLPGAVSNFSDLQNEIKALPGSAQEQDLLAYFQQKFKESFSSEKANLIVAKSLVVVQNAVAQYQSVADLVSAIKN